MATVGREAYDGLTKVQRASMSDQVARILREQILSGKLRPGERLVQSEWAHRLQVSRMPVRDALNQLATEGAVLQSRNGAAVVAHIDPQDIRDGYELTNIISSFAASRAASRITGDELSDLQEIHQELAQAVASGELGAASGLNWEFHRMVNRAARSTRLNALLRQLSSSIPHAAFELVDRWPTRALTDHGQILKALEDRDEEGAAELMYRHIEDGSKHMIAMLEERSNVSAPGTS